MTSTIIPIQWTGTSLKLLDQRMLPQQEILNEYTRVHEVSNAIKQMVVRGAPAIGITAAYGVVLAVIEYKPNALFWVDELSKPLQELGNSRPTAVNLVWAIEEMKLIKATSFSELLNSLMDKAIEIHQQEIDANIAMSNHGAALIDNASSVLTHCNTGTLATSGVGTALGVIKQAWHDGKIERIYADETRPWLQGTRLTMWEFSKQNIPAKLICEGAAASVFAKQGIDWVIVGADRITANGDAINKIGTYSLAVHAKHHGAKFMVVAPESTIDMSIATGLDVEIEERDSRELSHTWEQGEAKKRQAPHDIHVYNPAFDVTPAALIDYIVTESGVKKI